MARLFTITPAIRRLSMNAIDTMIDQLGKDCLLVFEAGESKCPNCNYDAARGASGGVYNGTGPRPFARPPCPVCRGAGVVVAQPVTKVIRCLIDWQPKTYQLFDSTGARAPQGLLSTKGYVSVMDSVIQCHHMIVDYLHADFENNRFTLWGEPTPSGNIVANRYFTAMWTRLP